MPRPSEVSVDGPTHEGDRRDVASHKLERSMRGVLAASVAVVVIGFASAPAIGQPTNPPAGSSDPVQQFKDLSAQAEKLNEDYLKAKSDLADKQAELAQANSDLAAAEQVVQQAQGVENQFRTQVDQLSDASYQGARFNQLSALLSGNSAQDFLERASALQLIASDNYDALSKLAAATQRAQDGKNKAADAQRRAQDATNAANQLIADIHQQSQVLEGQFSQVKAALNNLSPAQRAELADLGDTGVFLAPPGAAGQAMEWALSQRGKPYGWGDAGPGSYDCSGLTMAAFRTVGVGLPHSAAAQSSMGRAVSRNQLQPGDLVFFGSPAHHVGIYVGDGKMVDAPNVGEVVKVEPLDHDYSGARRLAG